MRNSSADVITSAPISSDAAVGCRSRSPPLIGHGNNRERHLLPPGRLSCSLTHLALDESGARRRSPAERILTLPRAESRALLRRSRTGCSSRRATPLGSACRAQLLLRLTVLTVVGEGRPGVRSCIRAILSPGSPCVVAGGCHYLNRQAAAGRLGSLQLACTYCLSGWIAPRRSLVRLPVAPQTGGRRQEGLCFMREAHAGTTSQGY